MHPKIVTGRQKRPEFLLVYGVDGVGKTTFAASAPGAIIVGPERGADNIAVAKWRTETAKELREALTWLATEKHDFQTVALDSVDHIEAMIFQEICQGAEVENIEKYDGGYGKGYVEAVRRQREIIGMLEALREKRGMNIVAIGHALVKIFNDPQTGTGYDRYIVKLNDKAAALWRESVDAVLFINYDTATVEDKRTKKARAFGGDVRKLYTRRRPAFDAKNRDNLPFEIPLSDSLSDTVTPWQSYVNAKGAGSVKNLRDEIAELIAQIPAEKSDVKGAAESYVAKAGEDGLKLAAAKNRLLELLGQAN